jgi:hypothetical protein
MSLDITVATRVGHADEAELDALAPAVPRVWLQHLIAGTAALIGVVLSSALGVVLFLR